MMHLEPVTQAADGQACHRPECLGVMRIDDEPRDFIRFVRDHGFSEERPQRNIGDHHARGHPRFFRVGCDAC